ncbi:hypothetical protein E2562_026955 [Oryza meyeriana var. granulata]|uniref:Uncharacterized protein n=1 Tax=Oryza meyeriana var. granulata TaxID=110450 RepID=A0A6G1BP28_9ORYZ|nr:hypothetical protein E2562_026955 [Oryza meyeriana var. granulata]
MSASFVFVEVNHGGSQVKFAPAFVVTMEAIGFTLDAHCNECSGDGDLVLPLPASLGLLCSGVLVLALPFSIPPTTAFCSPSRSPPHLALAFSAAADATDSEASSSSFRSSLLFTTSFSGSGGLGRDTDTASLSA